MLLFHGTVADDRRLASIEARGLVPPESQDWAHALSDLERHVFLSTTPVASSGGDPIAFARGLARWRTGPGWIIVVDLPADANHHVVGAVPNGELERWWQTRSFRSSVELAKVVRLTAAARERTVPVRELLRLGFHRCEPGLVDGEPDPRALLAFATEYPDADRADKPAVARRYGVRLPDDFLADSHAQSCQPCLGRLFSLALIADDVLDGGRPVSLNVLGGWATLDEATAGYLCERTAAWLDTLEPPAVERAVQRGRDEGWAWLDRQPVPRDLVPRTMWPDMLTRDLATRQLEPDTQVLASSIPPACVIGAIELGARGRLPASIRPRAGETLAGNLWRVARELRAAWTGRMLRA